MNRIPGTVVFSIATLVLLAGAGLEGKRGLELHDPLRLAFALILTGFAAAMGYEAFAYGTRLDPTISLIVSGEFLHHPLWYVACFLPVMVLSGALSLHFVNVPAHGRWWVFAAGALAYVLGGLITWRSGWIP